MGIKCYGQKTATTHCLTGRPVTGGGEGCCVHAGILGLFTFFAVEHPKVRQNCHKIENHHFQFTHKIKKKFCQIWLYSFMIEIKIVRNLILNKIDSHGQPSILIIKLYDQIWQNFFFNLMNKFKIIIFNLFKRFFKNSSVRFDHTAV